MADEIAQDVEGLKDELIAMRRDFHRNPELSFQEHRTGELAASRLESLGWAVTRGGGGDGSSGPS